MASGKVKKAYFELLLTCGEEYDETYNVRPFKILIVRDFPPKYLPRIEFESLQDISTLREVCNEIKEETLPNLNKLDFNEIFNEIKGRVWDKLKERKFSGTLEDYSTLGAYEVLKITRIAPFLLDKNIEEFFIDGWRSNVYLTHSTFGKMDSDIILTKEEIDAISTHLQLYSGRDVSGSRTTLKTELRTNDFHVRINLDVEPLAVDGPSISVRNLRRKYFTIIELIRNHTLSIEAAAFLI
ncbi:hypothetical protein DRN86_01680, partial [Candidatus Geothermarchaeota archaeon]